MAKPPAPPPTRGPPPHSGERRGSNFGQNFSNERAEKDAAAPNHPSETEEKWSIGSKFKPAPPERENSGSSFGRKFHNGRPGFGERGHSGGDSAHGSPTPITPSLSDDNSDWRTGPRKVIPSTGSVSRQGSQESPGKAVALLFPCCSTNFRFQVQVAHLCGARSNSCQDLLTHPLYRLLWLRLRMVLLLNPAR
jgi:hypothetical protein